MITQYSLAAGTPGWVFLIYTVHAYVRYIYVRYVKDSENTSGKIMNKYF